LQIVAALEHDIAGGTLPPGTRLLPHRDMAERLGLSVGTVSKAYDEAEKRGLISGEVGRGTFVLGKLAPIKLLDGEDRTRRLNLALNTPPSTGEDALIADTLIGIADGRALKDLLPYLPHQGSERHRAAIAGWLNRQAMPTTADTLFVTHGAQHAISIAIGLLANAGDTVLAENLTYSGMRALANHEGYRLRGVAMDERGLIPEQLDRAFTETAARVVYCMPTLQTPTGCIMPPERREQIIDIVRKHDAFLIEDDAYGFLCDPPMAPLSASMPERSFYLVSFAKCLAPGLRIGAMVAPPAFRDRCINALRSTGWMATPLMAEVVSRVVGNGRLGGPVGRTGAMALWRTPAAPQDTTEVVAGVRLVDRRAVLEKALASGAQAPARSGFQGEAGWGGGAQARAIAAGDRRRLPAPAGRVFDPQPETLWSRLTAQFEGLRAGHWPGGTTARRRLDGPSSAAGEVGAPDRRSFGL
jgi:DNA-binding transcriptional MocR family regulator